MKKVTTRIKIIEVGKKHIVAFSEFIHKQGVIGLAIAIVLGGAVGVMVKSLVDNIVMPPLGLLLGSTEGLKGLSVTMGKTSSGAPAELHYGIFINDFINFIVIALVVYFLITLLKIDNKK